MTIAASGVNGHDPPVTRRKPVGCCTHAFAVTTKSALATPASRMGAAASM